MPLFTGQSEFCAHFVVERQPVPPLLFELLAPPSPELDPPELDPPELEPLDPDPAVHVPLAAWQADCAVLAVPE